MKPSWLDAPDWANYLARGEHGGWFWFDKKPVADRVDKIWSANANGCVFQYAGDHNDDWDRTLERRP